MPRNTIDLHFADGEYTCALPAPRIDELQRKTGMGIGGLLARLLKGLERHPVTGAIYCVPQLAEFYYADIVETIRQGLIGGGKGIVDGVEIQVTPMVADNLVRNYVLDRPLTDSWTLAASILGACVSGYDPPKKDEPASERAAPKAKPKSKAGSTTASS